MKMASMKQFILCSNLLVNWIKVASKKPFSLRSWQKNAQKAIFRRKNTDFWNTLLASFAYIFLGSNPIRWNIWYLSYFSTWKKVWVADIFTECSFLFLTYYSTLKNMFLISITLKRGDAQSVVVFLIMYPLHMNKA